MLIESRLSSYFQRLDALRWTPYLDECVAVLAENEELPTDTLLVHLIKLQLIVEEVGRAPWHEGYGDATDSARAPPTFYLKALQAQLHDFKAKIPPGIQRNGKKRAWVVLSDAAYQSIQTYCSYTFPAQRSRFRRLPSRKHQPFSIAQAVSD